MQQYSFDIINARFIASGVAVQAKGLAYRLRFNKDRDDMRQEDYQLDITRGITIRTDTESEGHLINSCEEEWNGSKDYWLGRTVLTNLLITIPKEGVLLLNDVVINISLQKEIVKTSLVGRPGTVKEYITDGDYQLTLAVGLVAVNTNGEIVDQYPERAVAQLREILERPEALEVSSAFLDIFNINSIVVTGLAVKQMTHSNRQVIEITAISDNDYYINSAEY